MNGKADPAPQAAPSTASGPRSQDSMRDPKSIQTLAKAYADICAGVSPWIALNEFFHEWFDYSRSRRAALVSDPILLKRSGHPHDPQRSRPAQQLQSHARASAAAGAANTDEPNLWRWAVFCAAAADYLCERYAVLAPAWIDDPTYTLSEPWYDFDDLPTPPTPERRAYLERTTPEPLRRRNILSGDRVFANKYEAAQRYSKVQQGETDCQ